MTHGPVAPDPSYRVFLRPIANPLPMAFVGLGGATGWMGIALAVVAVYAVVALELEGVQHRPVLPTLRFGAARRAVLGGGESAIGPAEREAGVRNQL